MQICSRLVIVLNSEIIWGAIFSASLSDGWAGAQFLVRLLPNMDGVDNAQGWEMCNGKFYIAALMLMMHVCL